MRYLTTFFIWLLTANAGYSEGQRILHEAVQYIGLNERDDTDQLEDLLGLNPLETPWCATFLNAILVDIGLEGTDSNLARSFQEWGQEVEIPEMGDLAVLSRPPVSWQGHVGIYIDQINIDDVDYLVLLGGNQDDRVGLKLYPAHRLLSIRRIP